MADARRAYGLPVPQPPEGQFDDYMETVVVRQPQGCTTFGWYDSKPTYTYIDAIQVMAPQWCPKDPAEEETS
jgi:hypothetical protein